jgi:putative ABC transport system permease protein
MHVAVRLGPGPVQESLDAARSVWETVAPGTPFAYQFLDERIAAQYQQERRWQRITTWAATLALVIAAAGLFGLSTLTVRRRKKEIGIRKALGASVAHILTLVSSDFLKLVGLAFLLATPMAYWGVSRWLQTFAYRIDAPGIWLAVAGVIAFVVAAVAVGSQAYRATRTDPASAIRSE